MLAGRGIVHSERSPDAERQRGARLDGIQSWVALPTALEDSPPRFDHHPAESLPEIVRDGARLRVLAGTAYGATSPVAVLSPTMYVEAQLDAGAELTLPAEHAERAVYVVRGAIRCDGRPFAQGQMIVFRADAGAVVCAEAPSRVMLLGGAPLDGERHIWWNFVASSTARIDAAKLAWKERRFGTIPGDDREFIPLPE
jgi:redox-sensitive bicupin YhaK (pirin superfamily)